MTNVFTRQSKFPRSTTLKDFCGHQPSEKVRLPVLIPTNRSCNPHPDGLTYQAISSDVIVSIWNPNLYKYSKKLPAMLKAMQKENFTCGKMNFERRLLGKPPDIKYTETTISRRSFRDPAKLPDIKDNLRTTRFAYTPRAYQAIGIVPS